MKPRKTRPGTTAQGAPRRGVTDTWRWPPSDGLPQAAKAGADSRQQQPLRPIADDTVADALEHPVGDQRYVIGSAIVAAAIAFVVEPFEVWLKVYELYSWRYYYSFPIYFILFLGLRWILERVKAKSGG
jgi:hypothetical protein